MRRLAGIALVLGAIVVPMVSARAATADVDIRDTSYQPSELTITTGDSVTWTNFDSTAHSVTSDDGSFDSSPSCVAGLNCMNGGASFPHTFNSAGRFTYHCRIHDTMHGTIIVQSRTTTTSTTTTTTIATTSTSATTTTSLSSDQPGITQASLPELPGTTKVALPKSIIRSKQEDDMRPWALAAVMIAGTTTIAGIVLVRRGRVPFG
jgi:plastocyanin